MLDRPRSQPRTQWLTCIALVTFVAGCPQLLDGDFGRLDAPDTLSGNLPEALDAGTSSPGADAAADGRGSYGSWGSESGSGWTGGSDWSGGWRDPDDTTAEPECSSSSERCDGLDNDCDGEIDPGATCPSGCRGVSIRGQGYMFCGGRGALAATAETACAAQQMRLVWIESAAENAAIVEAVAPLYASLSQVVTSQDSILIGAQDIALEGSWRWGAAGPIFWLGTSAGAAQNGAYQKWSPGKPNDNAMPDGEDCGVLYVGPGSDGAVGEWNDIACVDVRAFLCETAPP